MYEKQEAAQLAMQTRFQNMERSQKQREHEFEGEVKKFDSVIDQLNNKCQQQKEELKQLQGKLGSYEADLLRKDR
jgi:peptidoglycan hydrolase CwlO-like protein